MKRVAVVLNPAKQVDAAQVREIVGQQSADAGWGQPLWFETTPESPGTQQAQAAVEAGASAVIVGGRSEEHTSELQSRGHLVCRLLLEKKKTRRPELHRLYTRRRR